MSASQVDPHNNMRARDLSKVTRGEQAPRPAHQYGTVSPPPPPSSTDHINVNTNKDKEDISGIPQTDDDYQTRLCYVKYVDYHRCILQKGKKDPGCEKLEKCYRTLCPTELVSKWDEEREGGTFPGEI